MSHAALRRNAASDSAKEAPIVNPSEVETDAGKGPLFRLAFGAYASTVLYVWADSAESAFEEAVEWLDDNAPGHLTTVDVDDYKRAAEDEGVEWQESWPDWEDPAFERVAQAAEADLTAIGHTTLKHGTHVPSWEWTVDDVTDPEERDEVVARSWAEGVPLSVAYERFGPNEDEPTSGLRVDSHGHDGQRIEITEWTDMFDATGDPETEGDVLRSDAVVEAELLFEKSAKHRGGYSGDKEGFTLEEVLRMPPSRREKAVVNAAIAYMAYFGGEESHVSYVGGS